MQGSQDRRSGTGRLAAQHNGGITDRRLCVPVRGTQPVFPRGRDDIANALHVAGLVKGGFRPLAGFKVAGVVTTERPFQCSAAPVTVGENALKYRQIDARVKQVAGRDAVMAEIDAGDLHKADRIASALCSQLSGEADRLRQTCGEM